MKIIFSYVKVGIIDAKNIVKIISPLIIFYGLYILVYGEDSPGGGFQSGAEAGRRP